jgi:DNA-binding beta-propeller fold protein YncE
MAAHNTSKVRLCIVPATLNLVTALVPTAITAVAAAAGKPAGVEVTVTHALRVGEVIKFNEVGFASLNNKVFVITGVTGTTAIQIGNVTLGAGALEAMPEVQPYHETSMGCLCLSSFAISTAAPATIDTSTYCGSSSIPSAKVEAGTATATGYVDVTDAGYLDILEAVETGEQYILRITLGDNGYLVVPVTLSGLSYELPLDGAQSYSFQFTFAATPKHVFA